MFSKFLTLIMASVILSGCHNASYDPTDDPGFYVKPIGRYAIEGDAYKMGWPGSGIRARFTGKSLTLTINDGGQGIMDVFVNGEEQEPLFLKPGSHDYLIVERDKTQEIYLEVTRRTEAFDTGLFLIEQINTDGKFQTLRKKYSRILFLGDSITAGFGVRGPNAECQYEPKTNAPYQTYAALTAKAFKAEAHFIAISGRGVVYNWDDNPSPVMPKQFDYILPDTPEAGTWNHLMFEANAIVIMLGTNDWSVIDQGENWGQGYLAMLNRIREEFPDKPIILVEGPLLSDEKLAKARIGIDYAVAERIKMGDEDLHRVIVTLAPQGEKYSCNYHPSVGSMKHMAGQLIPVIEHATGWEAEK